MVFLEEMKMKNKSPLLFISVAFLLILVCSCKNHHEEYHSITDKIEAKSKKYHSPSFSSENHLGDKKMICVEIGDQMFLIPERKSQITSYSCTECHTKPLQQMQSKDAFKKAHWNITLEHADQNTMNCITCHDKKNVNMLTSITGGSIDFNLSHQLCAQCHTKQFDDWKGGAHGKQIGGWAPPRASMTCVNCHNPHTPQFESKWPARFNTQKSKERK